MAVQSYQLYKFWSPTLTIGPEVITYDIQELN